MRDSGPRLVPISGCSGGGKSALLAELSRRGHRTVEEPGRRIVVEEMGRGGTALPWVDLQAFLRRAIEMSLADLAEAERFDGLVFFDRGLIDAASALEALTGEPALLGHDVGRRYDSTVFLAPPWPELYETDAHRRHGYDEAVAEYERLVRDYPALGYDVVTLPCFTVEVRADFVLDRLGSNDGANRIATGR